MKVDNITFLFLKIRSINLQNFESSKIKFIFGVIELIKHGSNDKFNIRPITNPMAEIIPSSDKPL